LTISFEKVKYIQKRNICLKRKKQKRRRNVAAVASRMISKIKR